MADFLSKLIKGEDQSKFRLAEKIFYMIYPNYFIGEWGKICLRDKSFIAYYQKYESKNKRSFERKYTLMNLLKLTRDLKGDTAELGVYYGASSELILNAIESTNKKHYMFDSWEGLSEPEASDGSYWKRGSLTASFAECKKNLQKFPSEKKIFIKGWIPETLKQLKADISFSFIHFDLDLYQPTAQSIGYFYDRLVVGGILVFDDYTFESCPGVKKAVDDFFSTKKEAIIELPFSAFVIKQ